MKTLRIANLLFFFLVGAVSLLGQNHSFSYQSPVCQNDPNVTPVPSGNFVSGGHYFAPTGVSVNLNTGVVNPSASSPGIYTFTYSSIICSCFTNAPVTATIQILPNPTVTISGSSTGCPGAALTLTTNGASSYVWSSGHLTSAISVTPLSGVSGYTVIGTGSNGCTAMAVKNVTVNPAPVVSISGNPTVCLGYSYSMQGSPASGASYTWSGPGLGASFNPVANATVVANSIYTLVASVAGCTNFAVHSVSAVPIPTISIIGSPTVCQGAPFTLYGVGGVTYTWLAQQLVSDSLQVPAGLTQATAYTVKGANFEGCTSTASLMVTVYSRPPTSAFGPTLACSGTSIQLTAFGANSYTWSNGPTTNTVNVTSNVDTTFVVTGSNQQGCTRSYTLFVSGRPSPTVSISSKTICSGQTASLDVIYLESQKEALSYNWIPGNFTTPSATVSPIFTTTYNVYVSLSGSCQVTLKSTVVVTPLIKPITSFSYSSPYCNGEPPVTPKLATSFAKGGIFSSNSGLNVNATTGVVDLSSVSSGFYLVTYSLAANGCTAAANTVANIIINKSVKILMEPLIEILPGTSIRLTNTGGTDSYVWSPAFGLDCPTCQIPLASPVETQVYCISSTQPCVEGSCVLVDVLCIYPGDYSVPNAFTPNKDGKNEKFCLQGWSECNRKFNVSIFDRWGQVVYESSDPDFCWDGNYNGNPMPSGVYVYIITARFGKEAELRKSGNISLIR